MEDNQKETQGIKKRIFKAILRALVLLILLLFAVLGALQFSEVQTFLAQKATSFLQEELDRKIYIDKVEVSWFDQVNLLGVELEDHHNNPMIKVDELSLDYDLITMLLTKEIELSRLELKRPNVQMNWYPNDSVMNIATFVNDLKERFQFNKSKAKGGKPIGIEGGIIEDGVFVYNDLRKDSMPGNLRFDHNHFRVDFLNAAFTDLSVVQDTFEINVIGLSGIEKRGDFHIHSLSTLFRMSSSFMDFRHIDGLVEESCINEYLRFDYGTMARMKYFADSVEVKAKLSGSEIYSQDLDYFATGLRKYSDLWIVSGEYEGKVGDFTGGSVVFGFGHGSYAAGDVSIKGFPNLDSTFMTLDLGKIQAKKSDIYQYVPDHSKSNIDSLTNIHCDDLYFNGYVDSFYVATGFKTNLGKGDLVYHRDFANKFGNRNYRLELKTDSLDFRPWVDLDDFHFLDGEVIMDAEASEKSNYVNTHFSTSLQRLYYNQYVYQRIKAKGNWDNEHINAVASIKDSNLTANLDTRLKWTKYQDSIKLKATVEKANLFELNFSKKPLSIKGDIFVDAEGSNYDQISGNAQIDNLFLKSKSGFAHVENIDIVSSVEDRYKSILLNSDFAQAELHGRFSYKDLYRDINNSVKEFTAIFKNDTAALSNYYNQIQKTDTISRNIDYSILIENANDLLHVFLPEYSVARGTHISGYFRKEEAYEFLLNADTKSITTGKVEFEDNTLKIKRKFDFDGEQTLNMKLASKAQKYDNEKVYEGLKIITDWEEDHMDYSAMITQTNTGNYARVNGVADFLGKWIEVSISKSDIHVMGNKWRVTPFNKIFIKKDGITFQELDFYHGQQHILLDGTLSGDKNDNAQLFVYRFDLENLNNFISTELGGELSGNIFLKDLKGSLAASSELKITDLTINKRLVGDLRGSWLWSSNDKYLGLNANLSFEDEDVVHMDGKVSLDDIPDAINLNARFNNARLDILEAVLGDYVNDVKGYVNGEMKIKGELSDPQFYGSPTITGGGFGINYFKTYYTFNDKVNFSGDSIYVNRLELTDSLWKSNAYLTATLNHHFFRNFNTNVQLDLNKTYILNTSKSDNSTYYGEAFGTGRIKINGPLEELSIDSKELKTERGTRIVIPMESNADIATKDYIKFVKTDDPTKQKLNTEQSLETNISGIDLSLNFNITNDAEFWIIFDESTGDILKGTGRGNVLMELDTRGDFNLYGDYSIQKGTYNFTLVNLINKSFKIQPNSRLSWNGDPYQGKMDVKALYTVQTSLLPIVNVDSTKLNDNSAYKRRVPVDVRLYLTDKLLNPDIKFAVDIREYPNVIEIEEAVTDLESRMKYNEQLLNQEVFSLLVLKQLTPIDQFQVDVAGGYANSVSELVSNQFSYWISQFDENLEIDIDVSGFDKDQANSFSLSLSYSVLDGRVRVTNEGSFQNLESTDQIANVFGDWTLEYLITNDGKLRVKAYNRINQNTFSSFSESDNTTVYGASFMYTTGFDNFAELFRSNKNKQQVTEEEMNEGIREEELKLEEHKEEVKKEEEEEKETKEAVESSDSTTETEDQP